MRIMVCYDGSDQSKKAVQLARLQAGAFDGEVLIVTTLEKGTPENQDEIEAAKKGLEEAQALMAAGGIKCHTHLLIHGLETGEDLVKFAAENRIDMAIIGIIKKSKVGKLFFGSTAQYLILNAPCPVLTVK
ncbi:MAG: universal stress protein [Pseudomonadota bacterium]